MSRKIIRTVGNNYRTIKSQSILKWLINHLEKEFSGFSIINFEWVISKIEISIIRVSTLRQPFIHESVWLIISYLEAKHLHISNIFSPDEVPKGHTRTESESSEPIRTLLSQCETEVSNSKRITWTLQLKCPKIIPR